MSRTINLAVIPGDGIGTEVVGEGLKVLDVVAAKYGVTFNKTHYDLGAGYWHRTGEVLPDSVLALGTRARSMRARSHTASAMPEKSIRP